MSRVVVDELKSVCTEILRKYNVSEQDAHIIADSIEFAHCRGKHTHGIGRMPIYVRKIKEGLMNPHTPMIPINAMGAVAVCDAENGFGQVAALKAVDIGINLANEYGVGVVGVRNSNNFGTAGFVGEYAAERNMICLLFTNSGPAIAPTGSGQAFLGTNPICISFPSDGTNPPIIFDMACSNAARGKVRLAAKNGETIPLGWAVDENGNDTTDPNEALKGSMIAVGGYKGYGLALCVDILAGMMTGSAFAGDVKNLNHPTEISRCGHLILVLNPNSFMDKGQYDGKMQYLIEQLRAC
jgi:L-2-hydroxycarboxylate dehydrogenase (NAD+)